jgi:predicted naringenin-chalcone synthase
VDEDILANLLFADGASALFVCGDSNPHMKKKVVLRVDQMGSAYIPGTFDLMTWNISSTAFRMYLDKEIVNVIKKNIGDVVHAFLDKQGSTPRYWAIHPGGIKILEAVKEGLHLNEANVELSMDVLREYGNMSSPTILFILQRIFDEIRNSESEHKSGIFMCAFGPGLSIEMIHLSAISAEAIENPAIKELNYVV